MLKIDCIERDLNENLDAEIITAEDFEKSLDESFKKIHDSDNAIVYNEELDDTLADMAATIQFEYEKVQLMMVRDYKAPQISGKFNSLVSTLEDLKGDFKSLKNEMMRRTLLLPSEEERRCAFRRLNDINGYSLFLEFISIFNYWTELSAEYLILKARCDYDNKRCEEFVRNAIEANKRDRLIKAQEQLKKEYAKKIEEMKQILVDCTVDLKEFTTELVDEYHILQQTQI